MCGPRYLYVGPYGALKLGWLCEYCSKGDSLTGQTASILYADILIRETINIACAVWFDISVLCITVHGIRSSLAGCDSLPIYIQKIRSI